MFFYHEDFYKYMYCTCTCLMMNTACFCITWCCSWCRCDKCQCCKLFYDYSTTVFTFFRGWQTQIHLWNMWEILHSLMVILRTYERTCLWWEAAQMWCVRQDLQLCQQPASAHAHSYRYNNYMCDIIIFWAVHKKFSLTNFADQHNYCTQYAIGCSGILSILTFLIYCSIYNNYWSYNIASRAFGNKQFVIISLRIIILFFKFVPVFP